MNAEGAAQEPQAQQQASETSRPVATARKPASSLIFSYVPHPHIAVRELEGPIRVRDQMKSTGGMLSRLNSRLALLITIGVGSMWAAYLFAILAFVSFPSAISSHNTIIIVAWIAQTFLQLVLLPIIIVGQNIQAQASDKRAEQTYKDAEVILHEAMQIEQHLCAQDVELQKQAQELKDIVADLRKAYPATGEVAPAPSE